MTDIFICLYIFKCVLHFQIMYDATILCYIYQELSVTLVKIWLKVPYTESIKSVHNCSQVQILNHFAELFMDLIRSDYVITVGVGSKNMITLHGYITGQGWSIQTTLHVSYICIIYLSLKPRRTRINQQQCTSTTNSRSLFYSHNDAILLTSLPQ